MKEAARTALRLRRAQLVQCGATLESAASKAVAFGLDPTSEWPGPLAPKNTGCIPERVQDPLGANLKSGALGRSLFQPLGLLAAREGEGPMAGCAAPPPFLAAHPGDRGHASTPV
ncbi:hypothetical protein T492DRAFT_1141434 [Pavlovales sp. CCMP2436]|nr:hypothetical protein T492DRAFT_1141434 [Pavlovales sp. CCMP2436]